MSTISLFPRTDMKITQMPDTPFRGTISLVFARAILQKGT
jgi:hypothetical protein